MQIDRLLEGIDLTTAYSVLAVVGALLAVHVMQSSWHDEVAKSDPPFLRNARRLSLVLIALSLLWSLLYLEQKVWQPWPPVLGMVAALDFTLFVRAWTLYARALHHQRPHRLPQSVGRKAPY